MRFRKLAAAAVLAAITAGSAAACGTSSPVTYQPAAYGANGQCYYDEYPAEAAALLASDACQPGWVPAPMPLAWQLMYYPYYSSPAYYGRYVPAGYRTVYVSHETTFRAQHAAAITTASKNAAYKSSSGKTVTGKTVAASKARFGSGSVSTAKIGGGSARSGTGTSVKSGSGSSGRIGGGSARSGGGSHSSSHGR